jgi:hypothetical protein
VLAPYWASKLGKNSLRAVQVSLRTGEADLELMEDQGVVQITARGVKSMEGDILVPGTAEEGNPIPARL